MIELNLEMDTLKKDQRQVLNKARLMQYDDFESFGYIVGNITPSDFGLLKTEVTPSWVYNDSYNYWTMTPYNDQNNIIYGVWTSGNLGKVSIYWNKWADDYIFDQAAVRPVIVLQK